MISIIIPTYNEGGYIARTLQNLATLPRTEFEVVVSDSQSKDNTVAVARAAGRADKVIELPAGKKRGISQGKNDGAGVASGDFFVFIDADVIIPDPQAFFKDLLAEFTKNEKLLGIIVPQWVEHDKQNFADLVFFWMLNRFYIFANNVMHSGNASGEFQMIRAEAFREMKGYREDLAAGEDNDMFRRLAKIGRTMSYANRSVFHSGRRAHKIGWTRTLYSWLKNGIFVSLFNRSPYKEWESIR